MTWLTNSLGACPCTPWLLKKSQEIHSDELDHRKFIQMNWLSEFCLTLPGVRANQAKARTHPHNCSGPKRQTSSRTSGPVDSSIWSLFPSGCSSLWVTFGNCFQILLMSFRPSGSRISVSPADQKRKGLCHFSKGHKEKPCGRQAGRRLRKMASLDTETERPRG